MNKQVNKNIISKLEGDNITQSEVNNLWSQLDYVENDENFISEKFAEFQNMVEQIKITKQRRRVLSLSSVAAIAIAAFVVYYGDLNSSQENMVSYIPSVSNESSSSAVTIEVDGVAYDLNSKSASLSQNKDKISVVTGDGHNVKQVSATETLKLNVPKGHQFEMVLSDGTKVWLNSDTELIYPAKFGDGSRDVTVKGEAFFDVVKNDKSPFIVSVNGKYDVEVLGTSFNINSYEEVSKTTLVSGEVKVTFHNSTEEINLSPSEQLLWSESESSVIKVNVESFISWKDQRFVFDNAPLSDIAKRLERYYEIDVVLNEQYKNYKFSGRVGYERGVEYFMQILKDTEGINCEFVDNTLFVGDRI